MTLSLSLPLCFQGQRWHDIYLTISYSQLLFPFFLFFISRSPVPDSFSSEVKRAFEGEKDDWERERESKMVVGGVFFVTLQASKCSQVHSAPWERWRTLGTFVATGMWCTQFAHGNKVRVRRIYYHILSVDVSEAGYDHNMRIPGKFLQGRGDGFRIKTTKSLNSFSHWVDRVMSLSVNPARTWNEVKKLPGCARFNQSNHSRCGMCNHSLTARSIQIRAVTCLQASAGWLMESH